MHSFETYAELHFLDRTVCWYQELRMTQLTALLPPLPQLVTNVYPRFIFLSVYNLHCILFYAKDMVC